MLKNYTPITYYTITEYEIAFDDGHNNGYGFPCDEHGHLLDGLADAAIANYKWCLDHPESFTRFNEIIERKCRTYDNAHGTCDCGNEVELFNEYCGARQCEKCGQWYNLFGQKLLPPTMWNEWEE